MPSCLQRASRKTGRGATGNGGVACLHSDALPDSLRPAPALSGDPPSCLMPAASVSDVVLGPSGGSAGQEVGGRGRERWQALKSLRNLSRTCFCRGPRRPRAAATTAPRQVCQSWGPRPFSRCPSRGRPLPRRSVDGAARAAPAPPQAPPSLRQRCCDTRLPLASAESHCSSCPQSRIHTAPLARP